MELTRDHAEEFRSRGSSMVDGFFAGQLARDSFHKELPVVVVWWVLDQAHRDVRGTERAPFFLFFFEL